MTPTPTLGKDRPVELASATRGRIEDLLDLFRPLARQADPWPLHWISGGDEAGEDYCRPCARRRAYILRFAGEDVIVDGGWDDRRESDGPAVCEGCGRLLGYHLTSYGLGDEIANFEDVEFERPLTPWRAYEIEAVLDAALYADDATARAAISIGETAAANIDALPLPQPPETRGSTGGVRHG